MAISSAGTKTKKRVIAIFALATIITMLMVLAGYPQLVERYYSRGLYRGICMILHPVLNIFPFSFGDLLYVALVGMLIYALAQLVRQLFKKRFTQALQIFLGIIIGIQTCIVVFYMFWGMNYFRQPAAVRLKMQDTVYSINELKAVTARLIDSANTARTRLSPADMQVNNDSIYHTALKAIKGLSADEDNFVTYSPRIKPALLTPLINYLGTSGYYNPFTSEAQINYQMPVFVKPFVACHELSHQTGFAPEDEANFAGFIAGVQSDSKLLKYSAYYSGMTEFMYALRATDSLEFKRYKKRISTKVMADLKAERAYWEYYEGRLNAISSIFYDNYLKVNNQPQGLMTYNKMITLVMAWYRDHRKGF